MAVNNSPPFRPEWDEDLAFVYTTWADELTLQFNDLENRVNQMRNEFIMESANNKVWRVTMSNTGAFTITEVT